jgi:hypothetical protein
MSPKIFVKDAIPQLDCLGLFDAWSHIDQLPHLGICFLKTLTIGFIVYVETIANAKFLNLNPLIVVTP